MPEFNLNPSQSANGDFNMDSFDFNMDNFDSFGTGQFLDPNLQPPYANGFQHTGSIRPSDLDANAFQNMGMFGASHSNELSLQIDPSLTESKGGQGQQTHTQPLTPATSLSPERFDALHSRQNSFTGAAAPRRPSSHKRKSAEIDDGDADAERRSKNRVAASKCRVKKKGREQLLIQESDQKEQENVELRAEYKRLTQEALWYKNQLITHGNCGDLPINRWLANSAAKIVHRLGEAPAFQSGAPSHPAARPSAEPAYKRRDSGISTNSKADSKVGPGSSPLTGTSPSVKIGLGSPLNDAGAQDVSVQLNSEADADRKGGKSMRRTRSLNHEILDALAKAATKRAKSVPLEEPGLPEHADGVHGDDILQDPVLKGEVSAVPPLAFAWAASKGVDSKAAVPWDAQLSNAAMTIDPRLRGGDMPLDLVHAEPEHLASPMQQDEQNHDELLQIPETNWMEA